MRDVDEGHGELRLRNGGSVMNDVDKGFGDLRLQDREG